MIAVDIGSTAKDDGKHRAGFPNECFWELQRYGVGVPGRRVVDLGTGTGTVARGLARAGSVVIGIDPSKQMMEEAARLDNEAGVKITYQVGKAENTGLADQTMDVVTAGQCWHWFDRAQAAREAHRILRPGGVLVIAHFDWLPLKGSVVEATEQLIVQHNPNWKLGGGLGIHPRYLPTLSEMGFKALRTFSFDIDVPYTHEAWRGRIRASAGIGPVLDAQSVSEFDDEHRSLLLSHFPEEPLLTPHRVWAVIAHNP